MKRCRTVTPQEKANLSYVTDLDQDLERLIRQRLGDRFPDDSLDRRGIRSGRGYRPEAMVDRPDRRHGKHGSRPTSLGRQYRPDRRGRALAGRDRHPSARRIVLGRQRCRRVARRSAASLPTTPRNFIIKTMFASAPMPCGPSTRARCRAGCATWEAPAASRRLWPPTVFRRPRCSANTLTTSPRESSSPPKLAARSRQSRANG